jgi:hypothetical protein
VPGTTMTPLPITKLPNSSDHRTTGSAPLAGAAAVVEEDKGTLSA